MGAGIGLRGRDYRQIWGGAANVGFRRTTSPLDPPPNQGRHMSGKGAIPAAFRYIARLFFVITGRADQLRHIYGRKVVTQYSKRMVVVHWLTLLLLAMAWSFGEELAEATDESQATVANYLVHMAVGGLVLLATVARLAFRRKDGTPLPLGQTTMDKIAKGTHHLLYTLLFVLPVSGMVTVLTSDALKGIMAGDASLLPKEEGFKDVFAHEVHEVMVNVLIAVVLLHALAAIKHQFIDKDGLMQRMMLRRKD
jgi:cytochrome b561